VTDASSRPIRWWPLLALVVLTVVALLFINLPEGQNQQNKVMFSILVCLGTGTAAACWFLFFARFGEKTRRIGLAVLALLTLGFFGLFEIREVSGDFIPIVKPRWAESYEDLSSDLGEAGAPITVQTTEDDYPRFQGPDQNNTVDGPLLADDWDTRPPVERWRIEIGAGWSAFAIVGNLAVTQEQRGDQEMVTCYDLASGQPIWGHGDATKFATTIGGNGPRATPTIHQGRVYTFGAKGLLTCLNLADGSLVWQRQASEENGGKVPEWGYAGSPLIVGDRVVVSPGGSGNALVAYDREDGTKVWGAGDFPAGYATPRLYTLADVPQIVQFYHNALAGHDPETGRVLWQRAWGAGSPTAANPLQMSADTLLVSSGYGIGCALIRVSPSGEAFETEEVYTSPRLKAKFANYIPYGDHVYGLDDGIFTCFDPVAGEQVWKEGRYRHGQLLLVGDRLLVQTERGDLVLVAPSPEGLIEKGQIPVLSGKAWNTMAISGNLLLMRNHKEAVALALPTR